MSDELKEVRERGEAFAGEHVVECAAELLEWSNTALLRDGRIRELAKMLAKLDEHHALPLAERFATRAALELAARPVQAERALTDDAHAAARWHYLAQHAVIIDASVEGMVSFTVARDADSGAGEDAAACAIDVLAAQPASGGEA